MYEKILFPTNVKMFILKSSCIDCFDDISYERKSNRRLIKRGFYEASR